MRKRFWLTIGVTLATLRWLLAPPAHSWLSLTSVWFRLRVVRSPQFREAIKQRIAQP